MDNNDMLNADSPNFKPYMVKHRKTKVLQNLYMPNETLHHLEESMNTFKNLCLKYNRNQKEAEFLEFVKNMELELSILNNTCNDSLCNWNAIFESKKRFLDLAMKIDEFVGKLELKPNYPMKNAVSCFKIKLDNLNEKLTIEHYKKLYKRDKSTISERDMFKSIAKKAQKVLNSQQASNPEAGSSFSSIYIASQSVNHPILKTNSSTIVDVSAVLILFFGFCSFFRKKS